MRLPRRFADRYVKVEVLNTSPSYGVWFFDTSGIAVTSAEEIREQETEFPATTSPLECSYRRDVVGAQSITEDPRWKQVVARDGNADGSFVYSVRTTGIYCRPSCAARRARPENVQFHNSFGEARLAGFRACQRCKPDGPSLRESTAAAIAGVCRLLEESAEPPTLERMASFAGMSPFHFHRSFKATTGITPNQYARRCRTERVRAKLENSATVTSAIYDAGFNSSSRFYESADRHLGMTASTFRSGGKNEQIRFALGECSLGSFLVASTERGVCAILIGDRPEQLLHDFQKQFPHAQLLGDETAFQDRVAQVVAFLDDPRATPDLPLDLRGTIFQQQVWSALQQIPAGSTLSYSELADKIGMPRATRAVARACATNLVAVAIPCHRVIRTDGSLSGYRWGLERKRVLLEREKLKI